MQFLKSKKGQVFDQLTGLALGLVSLAIVFIVAFLIYSKLKANSTVSADANSTASLKTVTDETYNITSWLGIIVITVIGSIILGLVMLFRSR